MCVGVCISGLNYANITLCLCVYLSDYDHSVEPVYGSKEWYDLRMEEIKKSNRRWREMWVGPLPACILLGNLLTLAGLNLCHLYAAGLE